MVILIDDYHLKGIFNKYYLRMNEEDISMNCEKVLIAYHLHISHHVTRRAGVRN